MMRNSGSALAEGPEHAEFKVTVSAQRQAHGAHRTTRKQNKCSMDGRAVHVQENGAKAESTAQIFA